MPENEQDTALNPEPPIANTVGQGLENEVPQDAALNPEPPKADERPKGLTPWEHGRLTGHVRDGRTVFAGQDPEPIRSPEFRAAEVLHGWSAHAQHTASPLYITRQAFEAAIEAAKNAHEKTGRYTPACGGARTAPSDERQRLMYPSGVIITVRDGGMNLPVEAGTRPLVVGVCTGGVVNTLYWVNGSQNLVSELGRGPGVEMLAPIADSGGALFLKVAASTAGTAGTPAVSRVGSSTGTITIANAPNNAYRIRVQITLTGNTGVGRFKYALDGKSPTEATGWSPEYVIPSGGTFALPQTGATAANPLTLTFVPGAGTTYFEAGDVHRIDCTAPHYTTTDLAEAFTVLPKQLGSVRPRRMMFAGASASASTAMTIAAAVAGHLDTFEAKKRGCRAVIDGGSLDTVANFKTALAAFTDDRVGLVYDPITTTEGCRIVSKIPFTGWSEPVVPFVNAVAERFARTELSESCGRVMSGPLRGVMAIGNDEVASTNFTAEDRIITACRRDGQGGFFITKPFIRSAPTSTYRTLQWGCVIDEICEICNDVLQRWIEANLRALTDGTGYLSPEDAARVEASVNTVLRERLVSVPNIEGETGHVSGVGFTVSRTNNYLQTGEIYGFANAVPLRENEGSRVTVALVSALPTGG